MARRLYVFVTATITVRPGAAFPAVIEKVKDIGYKLVDFDEISRRIVFRAEGSQIATLPLFLKSYASSSVIEVKAAARRVEEVRPPPGSRVVRYSDRLLFYYKCGDDWSVRGEFSRGKLLLKLCRSASLVDPAQMPTSLCTFSLEDAERLDVLIEAARNCFERLANN